MSQLSELDLKSVKDKRYQRERFLWEALEDGSTVLLKGSWLVDFVKENPKGRLPRRQDLPSEAVWLVSDLKLRGSTMGEDQSSSRSMSVRKKEGNSSMMDGKRTDKVHVMAFSFVWADTEGPDNEQLEKLVKAIDMRIKLPPKLKNMSCHDVALFIDYACLPQPPFSREDREVFYRALKNVHLWYAHDRVTILLHVPTESKRASGVGKRASLFSNPSVQSNESEEIKKVSGVAKRSSVFSNQSVQSKESEETKRVSGVGRRPSVFSSQSAQSQESSWARRPARTAMWSPDCVENTRGSRRVSDDSIHSGPTGGFARFLRAVQSLIKYSDHIIDLEFLDAPNVDLSALALQEGCKPGKCVDWKDLMWKCREGCAPAHTPDVFAVELQTKQFTLGNQIGLVKSGFALTLSEVLGSANQLQSVMLFASQDDSDISNSHFMSYYTSKENLNGMKALADALEDPEVYSFIEVATFTIPGAAQTRATAALKQSDRKAAVFTAYNDSHLFEDDENDDQPWSSRPGWDMSRSLLAEIAKYCNDDGDYDSDFDTTIDI